MTIQVEEYTIEDQTSEMAELAADGSAALLVDELGLEGQKRLVSTDTATRNPFRRITTVEEMVFRELFPECTILSKFDTEVIPVRVLELAKRAVDCKQFVKLEVWHSPTRKDDPILVAYTGTANPQSWDKDYITRTGTFLIARWGTALADFADLQTQAMRQWLAKEKSRLQREIDDASLKLKRIAETCEARFLAGQNI